MVALVHAALPSYEVLIASAGTDLRELCTALAVRLKGLPLRIEARVLAPNADPCAEELSSPGTRSAAVLILGAPAQASANFGIEQLYAQLVERCGGRVLAVLFAAPPAALEPVATGTFAAFRARLRDRHRTRVLSPSSATDVLCGAISESVCAMLCEELALSHPQLLERLFAEPADASPARLTELLGTPALESERPAAACPLPGAAPTPLAHRPVLAPVDEEERALDPLREPARASALEQRREGLAAFALGEYAIAVRHLRGALEQLPLDVASGYALARLLVAEGGRAACTEASRVAQRAARVAMSQGRAEDAALAHAAAARAESELGHHPRAEQQAREAVNCAPWLPEPWIELAAQSARRGELEASQLAVREAFLRDPRALLRLNREPALREATSPFPAWKERLRQELAAEVRSALDTERRVVRLLSQDDTGLMGSTELAEPAGDGVDALPLLDVVALGREAADRSLQRLVALGRQLRDAARDLGAFTDPSAQGELLPLRLPDDTEEPVQVLNWLYGEGERVACGRPVVRYETRSSGNRELRALAAPRTGVLAHIQIQTGAVDSLETPLGALRIVQGQGIELADRLENARAEAAEQRLGTRRAQRERRSEWMRVALWGLPALVVIGITLSAGGAPRAGLRFGASALLAAPAAHALLQALRGRGRSLGDQHRLAELTREIAQTEIELAHLWDEFRLLGDRFSQAVAAFEEGMPAAALFTPGPDWSRRAWTPGILLRLRSKEQAPDEGVELDEQLFPPQFAAHLPAAPAPARAAFYRVTARTPTGVRAARWASYFPPREPSSS